MYIDEAIKTQEQLRHAAQEQLDYYDALKRYGTMYVRESDIWLLEDRGVVKVEFVKDGYAKRREPHTLWRARAALGSEWWKGAYQQRNQRSRQLRLCKEDK